MEAFSQTKLEFQKVLNNLKEYAFSNYGRTEALHLKPVENPIEELKKTREMLHLMFQEGEPPVGGIFDVRDEIEQVRTGDVLEPLDLLKIKNTVLGIQTLIDWFEELEEPYPLIKFLVDGLSGFPAITKKVENAVDQMGEIKDSASPKLKEIRVEKRRILNNLKNKLDAYISSGFSNNLQQSSYFLRDGRYVLPVKNTSRSGIKGIIHSTSSSGATYYMEPEALVELNDKSKEIHDKEREEINRILRELSMFILNNIETFDYNNVNLVEFDLLWTKAKFAVKNKGVVPELSEKADFTLLNVRHPLIAADICVPITVSLGNGKRGIVITGPNTGGKTVTLKTIGLSHLMGLCGIPILADKGSKIGFYDHIMADIGDEQSIEQSLSTFSGHLRNITEIVKCANEKTLVLLDELGAGTDPVEGAALALGLLEVLLEKKAMIVVTSHLSPLKLYCFGRKELINASVSFDVETLSPTYNLRVGLAGSSNAFEIAKHLGVPNEVLESAEKFKTKEYANVDEILNTLHDEKKVLEEEKSKATQLRKNLESQETLMQEKLEKLRKKKIEGFMEDIDELDVFLTELKKEAESAVNKVKKTKHSSLDEAKQVNQKLDHLKKSKLKQLKSKLAQADKTEEKVEYDKIQSGDRVKIKGTEVALEVVDKHDGKVIVQNGPLKVEVNPMNLIWAQKDDIPDQKREEKYAFYGLMNSQVSRQTQTGSYSSHRLDIRGHTVEEGVEKLNAFLENMMVKNQKIAYVVHGKGTGRLAEGIWDYLNHDPRISSFRIGKPKEGGTGVTVIDLG
ncbi:MAG: endonuclease MutS2 [Thermotogota bacterium]|nr:endonuclease MutS2 [Thermotogota bacterium]